MPAKITKYDPTTQTCSVQISIMRNFEGIETPEPWPVIPNVPVIFPRATVGTAYIHMPLTIGDDVTLVVCERSLDNWKDAGLITPAGDRRRFNMTDAFAIPGGSGTAFAFNVNDAKAVEVANVVSLFQLKPTGEIVLKNPISSLEIASTGKATLDAPLVDIGAGASHGVGLGDVIESRLSALESALATLTLTFGALHTHPVISLGAPTGPPVPIASPFVPVPTPAASLTVKVST